MEDVQPTQTFTLPRWVNRKNLLQGTLIVTMLAALVVVVRIYYPLGVDWEFTYSELPKYLSDPYELETFTNSPWIIFFLPHAFLPVDWGNAINFVLTIVVLGLLIRKYRGGWQAMLLTFTSPVLLDIARTNNIDWLPGLAFLVPPIIGIPIMAVKPQVLGGAALIWWKKKNFSIRLLIPLIVLVLTSFILYGFWPFDLGVPDIAYFWNFAPFPFMIPLGLWMLWQAWKKEDEILAAGATPFLTPYFAPYSIAPLMALIASRHRKVAFIIYIGLWMTVIVDARQRGTFQVF